MEQPTSRWGPEPTPLPHHVRIAVVGAGFGGIGAAVRLTRAGHDVLVLERAAGVGGTWRDNRYPGAACDVQSHLYCFSFAPNPDWSREYAPQDEIRRYLEGVVERFGVRDRIRCGVTVLSAVWDEQNAHWRLHTTAGDVTAETLVSAAGALSTPYVPTLPGLERFGGRVMHSAQWDPAIDLRGRRVAVVGTGASAIQIVPRLAEAGVDVTLFQRTAPWVLPRHDRPIPPERRLAYARSAWRGRLKRARIYAARELRIVGFAHLTWGMRTVEWRVRRHLRRQIADPALRARLTPTYRAGCKRILLADDYYPALARPNVHVIPHGVTRVEPGTVVASDGSRHAADTIVLATGFLTKDTPLSHFVVGRDGRLLSEVWGGTSMQALRGTTVHGFPNLFFLLGPNTALGHTSMIHVIESQLTYLVDALRRMDAKGLAAIEPSIDAQNDWNDHLQYRMAKTVWATGGCASWYHDARGRVTALWPGSTAGFRWHTRRLDLKEYLVTPRTAVPGTPVPGTPVPGAPAAPSLPTPTAPVSPASGLPAPAPWPVSQAHVPAHVRTGGRR